VSDDETPKPVARTKECKQCGKVMSVDRFVCQDCGYVYPWFKMRLYLGGCGVVFFFASMLIYALASIYAPPPELPDPEQQQSTPVPTEPAP